MKKYIKHTFIATMVIGMFSCADLDEEIQGDYTQNFEVQNPGLGLKQAGPTDGLEAAFARVLNGTANHGSYFSVQEVSSDEAVITQKGGDWFDGGIWLDMHQHKFTPASGGINGAWNDSYGGIFQCNNLLTNGKPCDAGTCELNDSDKAQVRTLRAYFYWRLLDLFGRVKIVTAPGVDVPQSTRVQLFDFIVSELNASIPNLPAGKAEYGRASQGAAYALLSRLYLNAVIYKGQAMYQEAIDAADMVINSGIYSLAPDYAAVFSPTNNGNPEHIFVAPFDEATGQGMNIAQMTLHYPSQLTFRLKEQPWNGYSTLEEFYNSYEDSDERKENNFIVGPQFDFDGNPILDLAFDKADPDGAPINYTPKINQLFPNGSRQAGARLGKFSFKLNQGQNMDNDFPLLRYAEVLLNKAEARARIFGFNDSEALNLVKQIRERAGVGEFTSLTEGQLLAERGRELFIESLRRTDLIRFGVWGNAWWEKAAHSDNFKILFPIPLEQINASQSEDHKLTQNPGY